MSVAIHLELAVTKYAPPYRLSTTLTLSASSTSRKTALRVQHTERGRDRETGAGAGVAGGNWSPGSSQPSGQQPLTGASVEGGDIRLEIVPPLYTSVLFFPAPKVIPNFGSDCSLERKRLCSVFPYPTFERSVGSYSSYSSSTGLRTFMILVWTGKKLKVVDMSVPMSKLQQHQLRAWLCFARTLLHACMPRPAGVRLQVQAARACTL